jgi:hypothetical protein
MQKLLNLRIFWICNLIERSDGYYYEWINWANQREELFFAGYNRRALNKKEKSFKIIKDRL